MYCNLLSADKGLEQQATILVQDRWLQKAGNLLHCGLTVEYNDLVVASVAIRHLLRR